MNKVFVVSKEIFISEEDHSCDVVAVCSSEKLASNLISLLCDSLNSEFKVNYFCEEFALL